MYLSPVPPRVPASGISEERRRGAIGLLILGCILCLQIAASIGHI